MPEIMVRARASSSTEHAALVPADIIGADSADFIEAALGGRAGLDGWSTSTVLEGTASADFIEAALGGRAGFDGCSTGTVLEGTASADFIDAALGGRTGLDASSAGARAMLDAESAVTVTMVCSADSG
jgi:hypothetical protein